MGREPAYLIILETKPLKARVLASWSPVGIMLRGTPVREGRLLLGPQKDSFRPQTPTVAIAYGVDDEDAGRTRSRDLRRNQSL